MALSHHLRSSVSTLTRVTVTVWFTFVVCRLPLAWRDPVLPSIILLDSIAIMRTVVCRLGAGICCCAS